MSEVHPHSFTVQLYSLYPLADAHLSLPPLGSQPNLNVNPFFEFQFSMWYFYLSYVFTSVLWCAFIPSIAGSVFCLHYPLCWSSMGCNNRPNCGLPGQSDPLDKIWPHDALVSVPFTLSRQNHTNPQTKWAAKMETISIHTGVLHTRTGVLNTLLLTVPFRLLLMVHA